MRILPGALFVGPQRAGTTWVYRYLDAREDVCVSRKVKETFFFDRRYGRGAKWYASHFEPAADQPLVVEVGPTYFHSKEAPDRVLETLGHVPIVVSLRNPVERTLSLYLHFVRYGKTSLPLRRALRKNDILVESNRYATNLKRWAEIFGRANIYVVFQGTLANNPDLFARQICDCLGLPFVPVPESLHEKVNSRQLPSSPMLARMGVGVAERLRDFGLYGIINAAKRLGLKGLFLSGREAPQVHRRELRPIKDLLMEEVETLEIFLDRSFEEWKRSIGSIGDSPRQSVQQDP